jgi:hypothetical protein
MKIAHVKQKESENDKRNESGDSSDNQMFFVPIGKFRVKNKIHQGVEIAQEDYEDCVNRNLDRDALGE